MNTRELSDTLAALLSELADGPAKQAPHMLNRGDIGLLRSLDKLSAGQASAGPASGASIAAHVDHLRYGLSLLNRWSAGEKPFEQADWTAIEVLQTPREVNDVELGDIIGSIAHFAYHVGAIRQIDRAAGGPAESDDRPPSP